MLIGEPGVGKSAIAEGLALRIIQRKVSRILYDKRVVTLDLASLVAGTKYRGQFEERMKAVMNELEKNDDIIFLLMKSILSLALVALQVLWMLQICSNQHWLEAKYNV